MMETVNDDAMTTTATMMMTTLGSSSSSSSAAATTTITTTAAATNSVYANRHIPSFLALAETTIDELIMLNDDDDDDGNKKKKNRKDDGGGAAADDDNDPAAVVCAGGRTAVDSSSSSSFMQIVRDGSELTSENLIDVKHRLSIDRPILVLDTAQSIGMKVPTPTCISSTSTTMNSNNNNVYTTTSNSSSTDTTETATTTKTNGGVTTTGNGVVVTVRDIANKVGHDVPVHVIDVEHQEEMTGWTFGDLVDYFEDDDRILVTSQQVTEQQQQVQQQQKRQSQRRQRKASKTFLTKTRHRVLNQISYEFSHTPLANDVLSPQFVRDIDWIDICWSRYWKQQPNKQYPVVQYYCLTSSTGCYTDFHIDFGGTSVWYHVMSGSKEFCLIEPTQDNLLAYERWLCNTNQSSIWLPNMISDPKTIMKIKLLKDQTLIIPSGYIHSVYTPQDSLVFGGNYLHGYNMKLQLDIYKIEVRGRVLEKFRFPYFIPLQFYAAGMYLSKLRKIIVMSNNNNNNNNNDDQKTTMMISKKKKKKKRIMSKRELDELPYIVEALEGWWNVQQYPQQQQQQQGEVDTGKDDDEEGTNKEEKEDDNCTMKTKIIMKASEAVALERKKSLFPTIIIAALEVASENGCDTVEEFLIELRKEQQRVKDIIDNNDDDHDIFYCEEGDVDVETTTATCVAKSGNDADTGPTKKLRLKLNKGGGGAAGSGAVAGGGGGGGGATPTAAAVTSSNNGSNAHHQQQQQQPKQQSPPQGEHRRQSTLLQQPAIASATTTTAFNNGVMNNNNSRVQRVTNSRYHIKLSSSAMNPTANATTTVSNRKTVKEEFHSFISPDGDDEWVPPEEEKKNKKVKKQQQATTTTTQRRGSRNASKKRSSMTSLSSSDDDDFDVDDDDDDDDDELGGGSAKKMQKKARTPSVLRGRGGVATASSLSAVAATRSSPVTKKKVTSARQRLLKKTKF